MNKIIFEFKKKKYLVKNFTKKNITPIYISWLNNKKKTKFSRHFFYKHNKRTCIKFYKKIKSNKDLFLAIFNLDNKNPVHIGNVIILINKTHQHGEMSILIGDENFINKGITTRIWGEVIKYVFKKYRLRLIISGTMANNAAMIKVFLKNKMKISYTPKRFLYNKKEIDGVYAYIKNYKYYYQQ